MLAAWVKIRAIDFECDRNEVKFVLSKIKLN